MRCGETWLSVPHGRLGAMDRNSELRTARRATATRAFGQRQCLGKEDPMKFHDIIANETAEAILSTFECQAIDSDMVVYLSTPITSGVLAVHSKRGGVSSLYDTATTQDETPADSIRHNAARADAFAQAARSRYSGHIVIDPSRLLDVPGFTQPDYHHLWCAFIERYSSVVAFNDSWEFSTGCALEFVTAISCEKETLNSSFQPIAAHEGLQLLRVATQLLTEIGRPTDLHVFAVQSLQSYLTEGIG